MGGPGKVSKFCFNFEIETYLKTRLVVVVRAGELLGSVNPVAPIGESAEPVCYIENTNLGFWLKSLSAL